MRYEEARERIAAALSRPLPGLPAQLRLAPIPRRNWPHFDPARVRHAAGLVLLFPALAADPAPPGLPARPARPAAPPALDVPPDAMVLLTQRADTLRHPGQISLPGGVVEPGETFEQAALREAHEEVALDPALVSPLGALTPVDIPVSGFRLHPIVGVASERPRLHPADGEVARVIEAPLARLLDPATVVWRMRERDGLDIEVPMLATEGAEIWGATAMVLAELLTMLGWGGPPPR